jgi:hypothetical protein
MTWMPTSALAKAVWVAGFLYDPEGDFIYARKYPLQRKAGYCWFYDAASPLIAMIIDVEPFYFEYRGKEWLIEPWKGQYGIMGGGEIGVYYRDPSSKLRFYQSVLPADELVMKITVYQKGIELFHRGPARHFWVTAFKWGVFTQSSLDVTMDIEISFPGTAMRDAFKRAARDIGYDTTDTGQSGIAFTYAKPHSGQPETRTQLEEQMQLQNKQLVEAYNNFKDWLGVASNDPNALTDGFERKAREARQVLSAATKRLQDDGAKKLELEAKAAYVELLKFVAKLPSRLGR